MNLPEVDKNFLYEHGYLLVKNVFSREEIDKMRQAANKTLDQFMKEGKVQIDPDNPSIKLVPGDLLSKPLMKYIVLDERLIHIAREILGEDPVYYGDSSFQVGSGNNDFHKDNGDRESMDQPDWQSRYNILRVGIYLQNHKDFSGGLKVRDHSHFTVDPHEGKIRFLDSEEGDVGIWLLTTSHSGHAVRLRLMPNLALSPRWERRFRRFAPWLIRELQKERIGCFMTYAGREPHLTRYINWLKNRDYFADSVKVSNYDQATLNEAKEKNLEIMKVSVS